MPADMPELPHGDTAENPMPAPNARRTRVMAAAAIAPAAIAGHDTGGSLRQGWKSLRIQKPSMPPDERSLPLGYGRDPKPNEKNKLAAVLFSFERVLDAADGVLNLTLNLVSVAFRLQLGDARRLADHLLDCAHGSV